MISTSVAYLTEIVWVTNSCIILFTTVQRITVNVFYFLDAQTKSMIGALSLFLKGQV